MAGVSETDRLMSEINVTPFVDVMLVLLIIFMVTAPMMVQGVDVALPETVAKSMDTDEENVTISIDKKQRIFINDVLFPVEKVRQQVAEMHENRPDLRFFLRADKDIPYGLVARIMADVKDAGVSKLGAITMPLPEQMP